MEKTILEILVDKKNDKWPWIFEHILIVLHNVFEDFDKKRRVWEEFKNQPNFSLEITKIWNRIRFFILTPKKYKNFLVNQIYAHFNDVEISEVGDYLNKVPDDKILVWKLKLSKHYLYPIKTFTELQWDSDKQIDPYSSMTSALWKTWKYTLNSIQINFTPVKNKVWKKDASEIIKILESDYPSFIKNILLNPKIKYLKFILNILLFPFKIFSLFFKNTKEETLKVWEWEQEEEKENSIEKIEIWDEKVTFSKYFANKLSSLWYETNINIIHAWEDKIEAKASIKEIFSTFWIFTWNNYNHFELASITGEIDDIKDVKLRKIKNGFILNTKELSWLVHLPTNYVKTPWVNWVCSRAFEPPSNLPIIDPDLTDNYTPETELTPIWKTNFRGTNMSFGMWPNDRRRHTYIIWKTGMGKSVLLENMIIDDIKKGRGVAVIDPHGDLAEAVIGHIPKHRTNQTIIFDPSDTEFPIAFNMLEWVKPEHRALVASGFVGIFKKIFGNSWGPRLEHILRNTVLALLEYPNATIISIPLMLTSEVYRNKVVKKITDPIVKKFWTHEFAKMAPNQKTEAAWPILNKVWQFLSSSILRNVLWQPKNTFNLRWAMDNNKIVIVNLSKWKIWEDASALLWSMMVTKFQMDAMSRADIPEEERKDFYLYVDEFQNFATDSFATILSEARKYKLNLVMANQYIDQMQESVKWAVFGNVWTLISFQVWYHDATILKEVLWSQISEDDLTNLAKYHIYLKQLIDWMPSPVFSASTFPPPPINPEAFNARYKKILQVSREKYAKPKEKVVEKINKMMKDIEKQEEAWEKKKQELERKKKEEKAKKHKELMEKQSNKK